MTNGASEKKAAGTGPSRPGNGGARRTTAAIEKKPTPESHSKDIHELVPLFKAMLEEFEARPAIREWLESFPTEFEPLPSSEDLEKLFENPPKNARKAAGAEDSSEGGTLRCCCGGQVISVADSAVEASDWRAECLGCARSTAWFGSWADVCEAWRAGRTW